MSASSLLVWALGAALVGGALPPAGGALVPAATRDHPAVHDRERAAALAGPPRLARSPAGLSSLGTEALGAPASVRAGAAAGFLAGWARVTGSLAHLGGDGIAPPIPNDRGRTVGDGVTAQLAGGYRFGRHALLSFGLRLQREGAVYRLRYPQSYLALGWPWLQLDAGYRDHVWSPAFDSAIALGTHAPPLPSLTLSNARALTAWRLRYELFLARLSESNAILYADSLHTGRPRLFGLRLACSPTPWLSIGGARLLQFGGGPREASAGDLLRALFDPHGYDNRDADLSRDEEFGNQIGLLAVAIDHRLGRQPIRLYGEIGADDTGSGKMYFFGNPLATIGAYLPALTPELTLRYEYSVGQNRWYEHLIYQDGVRHAGHVLGHWLYDFNRERWRHEIEAELHSLMLVHTTRGRQLAATLRHTRLRSFPAYSDASIAYRPGLEADLVCRHALADRLGLRLRTYGGLTPRNERFFLASIGVETTWGPPPAVTFMPGARATGGAGAAVGGEGSGREPGRTGRAARRGPAAPAIAGREAGAFVAIGSGRAFYDLLHPRERLFVRDLLDLEIGLERPLASGSPVRFATALEAMLTLDRAWPDSYSLLAFDVLRCAYEGWRPLRFEAGLGLLQALAPVNALTIGALAAVSVALGSYDLGLKVRAARFEVDYDPHARRVPGKYQPTYVGVTMTRRF